MGPPPIGCVALSSVPLANDKPASVLLSNKRHRACECTDDEAAVGGVDAEQSGKDEESVGEDSNGEEKGTGTVGTGEGAGTEKGIGMGVES
jgi:hypothetical protein